MFTSCQVKENAGDISELREALEAVEGRADEDHKLDLASEAIDEEVEELRSRVENKRSFFSEVLEEGEESLDLAIQPAVRHDRKRIDGRQLSMFFVPFPPFWALSLCVL